METNALTDVYGIVISEIIPNYQYYVWSKESKSDILLQMDRRKPVKLGTWVNMRFNGSEYQNPNFKVNNYEIVNPIYKTEVDGYTVRVKFEQYLNSNLKELDHWFFGKIYNNRNKEFASGIYYLTIKKVRGGSGYIWVIENVDATEPKQPENSGNIGIVYGKGKSANNKYIVWCKERNAEYDVVIFSENPNVKIGTWLKLDLSPDQLSLPYLECPNFTVFQHPIYPTFLSENDKLCLTLELDIPEGSRNITHPFVGEIINNHGPFDRSGKYQIIIMRVKIGPQVGWYLKEKTLLGPLHYSPTNQLQRNLLTDKHLQQALTFLGIGVHFKLQEPLAHDDRYRDLGMRHLLVQQFQDNDHPREQEMRSTYAVFQTSARQTIPRQRSSSTPRNEGNPIRPILRQQTSLRPRSRSRVRFQSPNVKITGIVVAQSTKYFHVWCRERLPGLDIAILKPAALSVTDWIQFSIARDELETSFKTDPTFQITEFQQISSKFQTDLSANGKSVVMKFDMKIKQNSRIEDINHDVMGLIINEKFEFQQSGMYSFTIYRSKKENEPRSVWHLENREFVPPTPMSRSSPLSSAAEESDAKIAIIMNISNFEHDETINVWIFDLKQQGTLKLMKATEKLNLKAGDMIEAVFSNINETWFSPGPITKVENLYTTRPRNNNNNQVDILVDGKSLNDPDPSHYHFWIEHGDFGDILDINDRVQNHINAFYQVWIQRAQVGNTYQWVVMEQIN
ncbi:unnamed protein product [Caenorhabditis nigoni]